MVLLELEEYILYDSNNYGYLIDHKMIAVVNY